MGRSGFAAGWGSSLGRLFRLGQVDRFVTHNSDYDAPVSFSADGKLVYFRDADRISVMGTHESKPRKLAKGYTPAISADGRRIVFGVYKPKREGQRRLVQRLGHCDELAIIPMDCSDHSKQEQYAGSDSSLLPAVADAAEFIEAQSSPLVKNTGRNIVLGAREYNLRKSLPSEGVFRVRKRRGAGSAFAHA